MQTPLFFSLRRAALAVVTALPLLFSSACKKDDEPQPPAGPGNIVQVASGNPDFSIAVAAVKKADLVVTLSGTGPFTVFAPTNAAFGQLGAPFNSVANIEAITDPAQVAALRGILLYHVLPVRTSAAEFPAGASAQTTARPAGSNDNIVYLSKGSAGVFLNGTTQVVTADVAASNGIIHAINKVLAVPTGTVTDAAVATPSLSVLVQALTRTTSPGIVGLLAAASDPAANVTVFAPTNAAFTALLAALNRPNLAAVTDAELLPILQAHVVVGTRAFSTDLSNNQVVPSLNGNLTLGVTGTGVTVRAANNPTPANVALANVLTKNGVVHVIDRVLLP